MPIYEYRCDNCGHEFETIRKVSEAPLTRCPACEKDTLKKKVSAAGFRLKGGGWYETDFKSNGKRNVAGEEKASSDGAKDGGDKGSGDAGASKSSESSTAKPAAKSDGETRSSGSTGTKAAD